MEESLFKEATKTQFGIFLGRIFHKHLSNLMCKFNSIQLNMQIIPTNYSVFCSEQFCEIISIACWPLLGKGRSDAQNWMNFRKNSKCKLPQKSAT